MKQYQPGTHIIATIETEQQNVLNDYHSFKTLIYALIEKYQLKNLGDVFHNFIPHGFTAVICLSESHISIHTWPEYKKVNLDIYLSNYERTNDRTVLELMEILKNHFAGDITHIQTIKR